METTRWFVAMAAALLMAAFVLRSFSDESKVENWVVQETVTGPEESDVDESDVYDVAEADVAEANVGMPELQRLPLVEDRPDVVEFAYPRTQEGSYVEIPGKEVATTARQFPGQAQVPDQSLPDNSVNHWASAIPSDPEPTLGSPFQQTSQESILEPYQGIRLDMPAGEVAATEATKAAEPELAAASEIVTGPLAGTESESFEPESFDADRPAFPESLPQIWPKPEERVAALPPIQDKPKFKKFGATKADEEEDEDEEDEDEDSSDEKSVVLSSSTKWKLAEQPRKGDRYKVDTPLTDDFSHFIEGAEGNFSETPTMPGMAYDSYAQMNVYQGKQLYANQRPLVELGRPWYQLGPISEGSSILGFHNHVNPQYVLFGDARSGFASNNVGGDGNTLIASQLNLFHHFKFTSTERFVAGMTPLGNAANSTRYNFDDSEFEFEGNANFNFAYFEGDLGAITGGAIGKTLPFDLPFAAGIVPLVFQNGIWMEDEILGFAVTLPARNSPRLDISNMDITFFAGYDRLDSPAFLGDNSAARVMGVATFIDAMNGHFEIDYAFLDDRTNLDRSYHNIGFGFTRRYGRFLSNSTRVIVNAGQQNGVPGSADGVLLLSENSLITGFPSTVVPYLNMFAGFDRPQSVGRNLAAGGILRNTGILFESDNLTGYPTLDATANDTFGMALGLNLLADEFAQQLIVEASMLGVMGDGVGRNALGDQYGLGVRYQLPLTNSVLVRADAMVGFLRSDEDISGARLELRKKF